VSVIVLIIADNQIIILIIAHWLLKE